MKLNPENHNPSADFIRELVRATGLSQRQVAKRIGVNESTLRGYLNANHASACPYPVQFCLEALVEELKHDSVK